MKYRYLQPAISKLKLKIRYYMNEANFVTHINL